MATTSRAVEEIVKDRHIHSNSQGFSVAPGNSILFDFDCALTKSDFSTLFCNTHFHVYIAIGTVGSGMGKKQSFAPIAVCLSDNVFVISLKYIFS